MTVPILRLRRPRATDTEGEGLHCRPSTYRSLDEKEPTDGCEHPDCPFQPRGRSGSVSLPPSPALLSSQDDFTAPPSQSHRHRRPRGDRQKTCQDKGEFLGINILSAEGIKKTIRQATASATSRIEPFARHYNRFGLFHYKFPKSHPTDAEPIEVKGCCHREKKQPKPVRRCRRSRSLPALPADPPDRSVVAELAGDYPLDRSALTAEKETLKRASRLMDSLGLYRDGGCNQSDSALDWIPGDQAESDSRARIVRLGPPVPPRPAESQLPLMNEKAQADVAMPECWPNQKPSGNPEGVTSGLTPGHAGLFLPIEPSRAELDRLRWENEQLREQVGVALSQMSRLRASERDSHARLARLLEEKNTVSGLIADWRRYINMALTEDKGRERILHFILAQMNQFGLMDGTLTIQPPWETSDQVGGGGEKSMASKRDGYQNALSPEVVIVPAEDGLVEPGDRMGGAGLGATEVPPGRAPGYYRSFHVGLTTGKAKRPETGLGGSHSASLVPPFTPVSPPLSFFPPAVSSRAITPPSPASFADFTLRTGKQPLSADSSPAICMCARSESQSTKSKNHRVCYVDLRQSSSIPEVREAEMRDGVNIEHFQSQAYTRLQLSQVNEKPANSGQLSREGQSGPTFASFAARSRLNASVAPSLVPPSEGNMERKEQLAQPALYSIDGHRLQDKANGHKQAVVNLKREDSMTESLYDDYCYQNDDSYDIENDYYETSSQISGSDVSPGFNPANRRNLLYGSRAETIRSRQALEQAQSLWLTAQQLKELD